MYITHPTHGAGTQPSRTQPPTATRKITLNAGQCVRQPRKGRGRNRQTPPPKKNRGGGQGGKRTAHSHRTARQHHKRRPNPPPRRQRRQDPKKGHRGTTQPKPATPSQEQRPTGQSDTQNAQTNTTLEKKRASNPARKRGDGGTGTTRPGTGTASDRHHKAKARHTQKKTHPHNPTKKGRAQRTPVPSRHAHTAHPSRERRGTSGGRAQTRTPAQHTQPGGAGDHAARAHEHTHTPTPPKEWRGAAETQTPPRTPTPHTGTGKGGVQAERARNHARPVCRLKPKPDHEHHKPYPAKEGQHHKPYPNTPAQDPSQDPRGYLNPHSTATRTQTQTPHNSRKPSVHSPGTEAARAMQLTRPNEIRSPGVRLHPKACAALGLEAERATPKRLGTLVPRMCMHALGTGDTRKSGEPLGFCPKEGDVRKHGGTPSRRNKHVTPAAISPPGVARRHFVGGQQSGLAGCKPPPLFKRGASSCSSQRQRQRKPWGASP